MRTVSASKHPACNPAQLFLGKGGGNLVAQSPEKDFPQSPLIKGGGFFGEAFFRVGILLCTVGVLSSGCQGGGGRRTGGPVLEPLSKEDAIRLVNNNIAQIRGTLRATGSVDGHFVSAESRRRINYNVEGTLFYLSPYYFRLDLKKLGDRQVLFGSNDQHYWTYTKEDNAYMCGRMGSVDANVPLRADQIIEALGLTPIPGNGAGAQMNVTREHQQIVFGGKEYWLDRRAPRLVRRIVFRNPDGSVAMTSDLSDYRSIAGGPTLPYLMDARWPSRDARLRFDVGRWMFAEDVAPGGPQFATPPECLRARPTSLRSR